MKKTKGHSLFFDVEWQSAIRKGQRQCAMSVLQGLVTICMLLCRAEDEIGTIYVQVLSSMVPFTCIVIAKC